MALTWASALVACRQGHREGGSGGTMTPGPMELRGPIRWPMDFRGLMEMTLKNWFVEHLRSFFFFGDHIKIRRKLWHFPLLFWSLQTGDAQYLSWPRAHVWLSAPLQAINEYINCFLWQIISCSPGCRTVSINGSGSGLAPVQNILAVQVWFRFTWAPFLRFRFGSGSLK